MWNSWSSLKDQLKDAIHEENDNESNDDGEDSPYNSDNERMSKFRAALNAQRLQAEKATKELAEVTDRLRISEMQNMEVSKEYRRLLIEKETEIDEMKTMLSERSANHTSSSILVSDANVNSCVEQCKREIEQLANKFAVNQNAHTNGKFEMATWNQELQAYYEKQAQALKEQILHKTEGAANDHNGVISPHVQNNIHPQDRSLLEAQLSALSRENAVLLHERKQVLDLIRGLTVDGGTPGLPSFATSNNNPVEDLHTLISWIKEGLQPSGTNIRRQSVSAETNTQQQLEKAQKDLARLRQHLLETEEAHTLSEMEASERIAVLEEKLHAHEKQATIHLRRNDQFADIKGELKEKEEELARANVALTNLQSVLELFQANQEETISQETKGIRMEMLKIKDECDKLRNELLEFREVQKRCTEAEGKIKSLYEEITEKTRAYIKLQEEFTPVRQALDNTLARLADMSRHEQDLVDKRVVKQLLMQYFAPGANRIEVLSLMARMLNFTDEQKQYVGLKVPGQQKGWLGFLKTSSGVPGSIVREEKNITDLWMEFLMKESGEVGSNSSSNIDASVKDNG